MTKQYQEWFWKNVPIEPLTKPDRRDPIGPFVLGAAILCAIVVSVRYWL